VPHNYLPDKPSREYFHFIIVQKSLAPLTKEVQETKSELIATRKAHRVIRAIAPDLTSATPPDANSTLRRRSATRKKAYIQSFILKFKSSPWRSTSQKCRITSRVEGIHPLANRPSPNTPLHQVKKMTVQEPITSALLQAAAVSPYHPSLHTIHSMPRHRMDILQTLAGTNKIRTAQPDLIETNAVISRTMAEADRSIWLSVSRRRDRELQLHADIVEGAR
jgi:hypothetical protein